MDVLGRRQFVAASLGALVVRTPPRWTPRLAEGNLVRCVAWRRLDGTGSEACRLFQSARGHTLRGVVAGLLADAPLIARYAVHCTPSWDVRSTNVHVEHQGISRSIAIGRDERGVWRINGEESPALSGLRDIDLGVTPSTNTLPIRRLELRPGNEAKLTAAWVHFPELTVRPLEQTYRNLGGGRYQYESRGGDFTADVAVDDQGLVIRYGDLWERSADWSPASAGVQ